MEGVDVNGGNAEVAREDSNLETVCAMDSQEELSQPTDAINVREDVLGLAKGIKMDDQEVNGDLKGSRKKGDTPMVRRKLRKFKANSTSTIESDVKPEIRERKRKLSEPDALSSEESTEFNGFDAQGSENLEPGSHVLKKLIAEAESAELPLQMKRFKRSMSKNASKVSEKEDDSDDNKTQIDEATGSIAYKIRKEKESDKSETDSIGAPNSLESETEPLKADESSVKSANSSANSSPSAASHRSRGSRISRGASPGSAVRQKVTVDLTNPAFKEPFKYGWKRELVYRAAGSENIKRMADIYYYTPTGKKVRSFREVAEFLNTKELTIDNFTFFKESLGLDDPEKEIIRDAKRGRDSGPVTPTLSKKTTPARKSVPPKKIVEEPAVPSPVKAVVKSPRVETAGFKVKLPAKRGPQKRKAKIKTSEESEMLPPQWSSPLTGRRSQQPIEKTPPAKTKRALKTKVQEPCSIRCSSSMGLIPSLQCSVCLCLYHPECVDGKEFAGRDDYVCKNCQQDSDESQESQHPSMSPSLTPPPLIPISMLGAQNPKSKHQINLTPPKLQRIPKSDGSESQARSALKLSKVAPTAPKVTPTTTDKKEGTWYAHARNEFLHSHDGTLPKPAQNIALMAGKKYIVVPKNNAMAVQPAITIKPDMIGDKPPILQDRSLTDVLSTTDNSMTSRVLAKASSINDKLDDAIYKDTANVTPSSTDGTANVSVAESDRPNEGGTKSQQIEVNKTFEINSSRRLSTLKNETKNIEIKYHSSLDSKSVTTPVDSNSQESSLLANNDLVKTDSLIPVMGSDIVRAGGRRRRQLQGEPDQRQHFMVSVCAGYNALSRIFQYLKVQELLRAARVCKMWRDLAAHPALWKTVRMKNSQVTDWDGLADSLKRHGTEHLDLRKMLIAGESDGIWKKFINVIPRVTSLVKLELCRCPVMVVEEVISNCPQLKVLSAMSIKCDSLNLEALGNLKCCKELKLKAISGMSLQGDLTPLRELSQLTHLSLTSVKELGKKRINIIESLTNLETLELGECSDFPDKFGTTVLLKLQKLERLRLEKGQGSCCTFDILEGVSKLGNLNQLELVNFDVKNGFDKYLANCKNIKRLLIIPTYISQSATSNNMVLGGVTELSNNLTHFVWGVTLELLRVTELFVDQCNQMSKQVTGDSIPVLKPVPCLKLIEDIEEEVSQRGDEKQQPNVTNPQVDILPLPQLQKLLLTALPKTRVKILKIPFHATWRQSISDTTAQ